VSYPVLCGAVVLTSANNRLRFREAAGAVGNVDLDAGTYYLRDGYATNLVTRSEDFSTTWSLSGTITQTPSAATAPDGSSASLLDSTVATTFVAASIIVAYTGDGEKSAAVYLKRNGAPSPAAATDLAIFDITASVDRHVIRATWSADGTPTLSTVAGSGTRFEPVSVGEGWWRISFTALGVVAANTNRLYIYPASRAAATGGVFAWGAQTENATTVGPYVRTTGAAATGPADELTLALKTKLDAFGAGGNTYDVTVARSIDPASAHTRMTITRSTGTDTFGLVVDGSQTFDMALIGFPASTLNDALPKVSPVACAACWGGNDVAREIEPLSERVVSVPRAVSGRVQGVTRSARMLSWRLGLAFVDERRMLVDRGLTGAADTLEGFMERFGAGALLELHEQPLATGTTLSALSASTFVDAVHFSEDALSRFEPTRLGPGVPLYSIDLRLHAKV
jgi:hypothetical protein